MRAKKKENSKTEKTAPKQNANAEDFSHELQAPIWSVVSFEKREAGNLTYAQAEQKLSELEAQNLSGLCIVTDETAERMTKN